MWRSLILINRLLDRAARRQLLLLVFFTGIAALLELLGVTSIVPFVMLLNKGATGLSLPAGPWGLAGIALLILLAFTLSNVLVAVSLSLGIRFAGYLEQRLCHRLLENFLGRDYLWHTQQHHADLSERVDRARQVVRHSFRPLVHLITRGGSCVLITLGLVALQPDFALAGFLLLGGLYGLFYRACRDRLANLSRKAIRIQGELTVIRAELFGAIPEIKVGGRERFFLDRHASLAADSANLETRVQQLLEVPRVALQAVTYGAILFLAVKLTSSTGSDRALPLIGFFTLAGFRLVPVVQSCFHCLAQLRSETANLESVLEDLTQAGTEPRYVGRTASIRPAADFTLRQIGFQYADRSPVLTGVQLTVPKGARIGITGPSGNGKTTLLNLLIGLLQPQTGELLVDGKPLADMAEWQAGIGYVPQESYLGPRSLRENIAFGLPPEEIDATRLETAVRIAQLQPLLDRLPNGLETTVGDRGHLLSAGERQRVGIARALYFDPWLLVLDEATNNLDEPTEAAFFDALGERTVLLVSHRASTLASCEKVYFLAQGQLQEARERSAPHGRNL